jgi:peptide/nickel transport system ATP-binding protein
MQGTEDPEPRGEPASARVRGLDIRFSNGVHALRRVDLELRKGEILGLVGESGSGKTLLGLSVLGLVPGEADLTGEAWLADTEMVTASPEARRVARRQSAGAVFQDPMTSLNPTMKVGRQVAEAAGSVEAAEELFGQVGIPDPQRRVEQYPHELSGGLRQRAMIAMAIARNPSVIMLDEPTTALDVTLQRGILTLLARLRDELGAAMLFITHDLAVAAEVADRVAVLYAGRIAEVGDPAEVFHGPCHPYTSGLLNSRLALAGLVSAGEVATLPGEPPDPRALPPGCPFEPRCAFAKPACAREVPALVASPRHSGSDACIRAEEIASLLEPGHDAGAGVDLAASGDGHPVGASDTQAKPRPAAELAGITKEFHSHGHHQLAVDDVSLDVAAGGALGLVGESGCGKTTLLRIVVGLERPDVGEVRLGSGGSPQMVFQDAGASLTPWLSVYQLLDERLHTEGLDSGARRARIRDVLALVGLRAEVADARPRELSGGQRQRVALARAVIVPPALLACDEPTSALDVSLAATVINLLHRLRRELGLALLFVTHDLAIARAVADEVAIMDTGRIVERGPSARVLRDPHSDEARRLLEAVPTLERTWPG